MKHDLTKFVEAQSKIPSILQQFGYSALRPGQEAPISSVMLGQDTIAILATGGGKTLLAALPTVAMEWRTIMFSPLVSLMRDQFQNMNRLGVRAACINSSQTDSQNYLALRDWSEGRIQILYVAPERMNNIQFEQAMQAVKPDLVVVDEAHCISSWSDNFRPSYARIGDFVEKYNPEVVLAMTATATQEVFNDIKRVLRIEGATLCRYYTPRTNLKLSSSKVSSQELYSAILKKCREVTGSVIVYCQTVKEVAEVTSYLDQQGESVTFYHGQISNNADKAMNMDSFMSGRARICVATNAFGMGIDKPDIEAIIHNGSPSSIEAVSQETGRAARDGRNAICHMFVTDKGHFMQEFLFNGGNPTGDSVRKAYNYVKERASSDGVAYVKTADLEAGLGDASAGGALNYLSNRKCVERFKPEIKMYTIGDKQMSLDLIPARLHDVVNAVREFGSVVGNDDGQIIRTIDLAFLVGKVGKSESTVKSKLRELAKEDIFVVTLPFSGLATRLIKPPTKEDIAYADKKRSLAWKKIADVREYESTPDSEKQAFLDKYFEIDPNSEI